MTSRERPLEGHRRHPVRLPRGIPPVVVGLIHPVGGGEPATIRLRTEAGGPQVTGADGPVALGVEDVDGLWDRLDGTDHEVFGRPGTTERPGVRIDA